MSDCKQYYDTKPNWSTVCCPPVAALSAIVLVVAAGGVIIIWSVDVLQDLTLSTNFAVAALVGPAVLICPVIVVVYTPATVGTDQATIIVDAEKVINEVLCP